MEETIKISSINPQTLEYQDYSTSDENLISNLDIESTFTSSTDKVEYFILSPQQLVLYENYDYPNYSLIDNNITINPESDLQSLGFTDGNYYSFYNILRDKLGSSYISQYYIKEISTDRTEIRLDSNVIDNTLIVESAQEFINEIQSSPYQKDFYLNFGQNILVIANNVLLDNSNTNDPTVLIKLYEPLPSQFGLKSELWVSEKIAESVAYNIQITQRFEPVDNLNYIKGPNLNLDTKDQINNPTVYKTYTDLSSSPSSSVQSQLNNILSQKGVNINVDYTDFSNFIKFSSAQRRIENFYYKVQLIEEYTYSASLSGTSPSNYYMSSSQNVWQSKINDIISQFDGYEYFLYSTSGSKAYPKTNSEPPYILTGSTDAYNWFLEQSTSGSEYDRENLDNLYSALPTYIQDDTTNEPLELFIDMLGQHYDNLWLYLQDVSNKFDADNRINYGVSKDLVADIIKDFGVKIYQNNFSSNDLYSAFFGFNSSGSYSLPTNTTGGLDVEANSFVEYIDNYVTSSQSPIPLEDVNKRIYKRIYHNLPYILNRKGTIEGLRALITSYGIPDTILRISEFGGKDKINSNDWDYWYQHYNKAYLNQTGNFISGSWRLNSTWGATNSVPGAVAFRFKPEGYPPTNYSQSIWSTNGNAELWLKYTSSLDSGSYSGSIQNEYIKYANLEFTPDGVHSASLYLPFFDGNWWSVLINSSSTEYTLYAKNNIYQGQDGSLIGFTGSATLSTGSSWNDTISYWGKAATYSEFSGSYQELRFYKEPLSESVFDDFVMNPFSIEGNTVNSSPNELVFRAPLGSELNTNSSSSVHPKVTGSWDITSSFSSNKNNYDYSVSGSFIDNVEYVLVDQPPVGIKNRISDKIKTDSPIIEGTTLSSLISIQQDKPISSSYTENINYLEVAFSPQNEINDDITSQLGWFNIGDYIGDPRFISSSKDYYPLLDSLRDDYFLKYKNNYQAYDYIRLIKYFDNSLFKMIKDFVPARTGLASGVVIKQHLLERNRYPQPQAEWTRPEYTASIGQTPGLLDGARIYSASSDYESIPIETITGSQGGTLPEFVNDTNYTTNNIINVTQSWSGTHVTPSGSLSFIQNDAREFVNGEFSGSAILTTNGELNPSCSVKEANTTIIEYDILNNTYNQQGIDDGPIIQTPLAYFTETIAPAVSSGDIRLWWSSSRVITEDIFNVVTYKDTYQIYYLAISKTSDNGLDLTDIIPNCTEFIIDTSTLSPSVTSYTGYVSVTTTTSQLDLKVKSIREFPNSYLIEVDPYGSVVLTSQRDIIAGDPVPVPYTVRIAQQSNTLTILNPYFDGDFSNSDCNPLINNVEEVTLSRVYYDIDYSQGITSPVNYQTIISGSATKAPIQDYNWHARRSVIPRYSGSKSTAGSNFNSNTIKGGLGTLPNVEQNRAYFAYFNWVGGTAPEWGNGLQDRSSLSVRYFIDADGNVIEPTNDSKGISLGLVRQIFTEGETAVLSFDDQSGASANFSNLIGEQTIFKSGKTITPIVYSQTASISSTDTGGYTGSLTFVQGDQQENDAIGDYRLTAFADGTQILYNDDTSVEFGFLQYSGSLVDLWLGDITYSPTGSPSPNEVSASLEFKAKFVPDLDTGNGIDGPAQVTFQFMKNGSLVGNSVQVDWNSSNAVFLSYIDNNVTGSDTFLLKATTVDYSQGGFPALSTDSFFKVLQTPPPGIGDVGPGVGGGDYWQKLGAIGTAGASKFKPNALIPVYGQKQEDISGSGFFGIVNDFILEVGDEIRFQGTETQTYKIINVDNLSSPPIFTVDRGITLTNPQMDWFLVRRYIDAPGNIIIEADKPAGGTSPGFFMPLYITQDIEDNFDNIIKDLKTDQLI